MFVRNIDWPEPCREKIGFRQQVVTIPIVRYVNITTQVDEDDDFDIELEKVEDERIEIDLDKRQKKDDDEVEEEGQSDTNSTSNDTLSGNFTTTYET